MFFYVFDFILKKEESRTKENLPLSFGKKKVEQRKPIIPQGFRQMRKAPWPTLPRAENMGPLSF